MKRSFDEIHVFENKAERTGARIERAGIRGRAGVCRSLTELAQKFRRLGDGYYYLADEQWPTGATEVDLSRNWETMS